MSERLSIDENKAPEHAEDTSERKDSLHTTGEIEQTETQRHSSELRESARKTIEQQAVSKEAPLFEKQAEQPNPAPQYTTKQIKNAHYQSTLVNIRKHLSPTKRLFSKIIHQPFVEVASEIGAKTIGRPSGILSGSLIALFGSLSVTIIARRVGFEVPSSIFAIFFVGGFFIGIIIETIYHRLKRTSRYPKA
jgi:tetrahydromethanopterin S-methyltransferase subunit G